MIKITTLPILAVITLFLAACSTEDSTNEPENSAANDELSSLVWSPCSGNEELECTTLSVPMNYNDERAGNIEIALNRLPALQQPASGVLLLNGGGPESSLEVTEIVAETDALPESVRERYDAISFDPRGFGESTPISCDVSSDLASTIYLANADMINTFVQERTGLAQNCLNQLGDYLLQIGSMNVVRDMESIRQALGVDKLSFIALSYGTRLAALYLQNFPENSEAFILDASDIPSGSSLVDARDIQSLQQENLESFLEKCTQIEPDCNPVELEQRLISEVNALASDESLEELSVLFDLIELSVEDPEAADIVIPAFTSFEEDELSVEVAQYAVLCTDDPVRPTATDIVGYLEEFNNISDLYAEYSIDVAGRCAGWPESIDPLPTIGTSIAPMSLVIGGTNDTTTPFEWSVDMASAIGGYLLASSHDDHTVVYSGESDCVDDIVTTFLVDGQLPTAGDCL